MFSLLRRPTSPGELLTSQLLNELTFYPTFLKDLLKCHSEAIIESPFVTSRRMTQLEPALMKLKRRKIRVAVNTRDPQEHDNERQRDESYRVIAALQRMGAHVLYTGGHHRKLAILDRKILYEGSLNILSQNASCEVMRRIESSQLANQMLAFLHLENFIG